MLYGGFYSREKDITDLARQGDGVGVHLRLIPRVNPVHHAEKAERGDACVELQPLLLFERFNQIETTAVVFALERGDLRAEGAGEHVVFFGEHLGRFVVLGEEIFEVVEDEGAHAGFGIADVFQTALQPLHDHGEVVLLNHAEELLFRFKVVIKTGQRKTGDARQVAHGGAVIALFVKNRGRVAENFGKTAVEARSCTRDWGDGGDRASADPRLYTLGSSQ